MNIQYAQPSDEDARQNARDKMRSLIEYQVRKAAIELQRPKKHFPLMAPMYADLEMKADDWRERIRDILMDREDNMFRVRSDQKDAHTVETRRIISMYLRNRGWSYPKIGEFLNRDHTSIYHLLNPEPRRERHVRNKEKAARPANDALDQSADDKISVFGPHGWTDL